MYHGTNRITSEMPSFNSADVWQQCYDLVTANRNEDDLLGYVLDDLIRYTGTRSPGRLPRPKTLVRIVKSSVT